MRPAALPRRSIRFRPDRSRRMEDRRVQKPGILLPPRTENALRWVWAPQSLQTR